MPICHVHLNLCAAAAMALALFAPPRAGLRGVKVGDPIPAFSMRKLDGTPVSNDAFEGRVLLLTFVRPEHEKSLQALTAAQRILQKSTGVTLAALGVSTKSGAEEYFKQIAAENELTFPIAVDPKRKLYGELGVVVAPTTLLIDGNGILRFAMPHMPAGHDRRLRIHVDLLLGEIDLKEHDKRILQSDQSRVVGQDAWTRRLGLARSLADKGEHEQVVQILTKLHTEKQAPESICLLGTSLVELGRIDEAAALLDPLAKRGLKSRRAKVALAKLEIARKNDKAAEGYLLDALSSAPVKGPILHQLGKLYERQGRLRDALDSYRKALDEVYG